VAYDVARYVAAELRLRVRPIRAHTRFEPAAPLLAMPAGLVAAITFALSYFHGNESATLSNWTSPDKSAAMKIEFSGRPDHAAFFSRVTEYPKTLQRRTKFRVTWCWLSLSGRVTQYVVADLMENM